MFYRNSLFFSSSKFSAKKYSRKKKFRTDQNENSFTSRVWWALIEEIAPRAKVIACEREMACCVRGYLGYKNIWAAPIGEALVVAGSQPRRKNFCCKIIFA